MKGTNNISNADLRKKTVPIYRVAVLGAKGVGKTAIVKSFVNNAFNSLYEETENDIRKYRRVYDVNKKPSDPQYIMFQIDDMYFPTNHFDIENDEDSVKSMILCGILENKQIRNTKKQNANIMQMDKQIYGYIFVYDVNSKESFEEVRKVMKYLCEYCEKKNNTSGFVAKKILVGNKVDLQQQTVKGGFEDQIKSFLEKYPMLRQTVSAKTSFNVSTIFEDLGKAIYQDIKLEMVEKEWFEERAPQIRDIDTNLREGGNSEKQEKGKKGGKQQQPVKKGFLCAAKVLDESDEEEEGYDEADIEFADVPTWPNSMDESNEACTIQ